MDEAWTDSLSSRLDAFDLFLCHALRHLGKRSGVPEDHADRGRERGSEELHRTPMRKKIHPRCCSSPSRHPSRMWRIDVWRCRRENDTGEGDMRGAV